MDLKQLQYFTAVVEEGSITAAAKRLYLSQPPLSTQIRLLEEELGCRLLERGPRQVTLTEAGKVLYHHALTLLEMGRLTKEEVQSCAKSAGSVRLGIVSSVVYSFAPRWIGGFSAQNPQIRFDIFEGNTYELLEKLRSGVIHAALIRSPFAEEGLICQKLWEEPLIAAGNAEKFPVLHPDTLTLSALAEHPMILYRRWEEIIRRAFEQQALIPNIFCLNDDARTTACLIETGLGIGILPRSAAALFHQPSIVLREIEDFTTLSAIELVSLQHTALPVCTRAFMHYLLDSAENPV